jgi:hypothetical protein
VFGVAILFPLRAIHQRPGPLSKPFGLSLPTGLAEKSVRARRLEALATPPMVFHMIVPTCSRHPRPKPSTETPGLDGPRLDTRLGLTRTPCPTGHGPSHARRCALCVLGPIRKTAHVLPCCRLELFWRGSVQTPKAPANPRQTHVPIRANWNAVFNEGRTSHDLFS